MQFLSTLYQDVSATLVNMNCKNKWNEKLQLLQKYSVVKNTKELAVNIYIIYIFIYYIYVKNR